MKFSLFITGCQYNYYDAKKITHFLNEVGYVYVSSEKEADLIIILSCSVRQKPMDRIYGKFRVWKKLPKNPKIIITACILPKDFKKLSQKVDAIINVKKFKSEFRKKFKTFKNNYNKQKNTEFYPKEIDNTKQTAFIPIIQGCNNFCTYCAVPFTRGPEKSRSVKDIILEIQKELKNGKKHIILLGQNVNNFKNKYQKINIKKCNSFCDLLNKIEQIPINFTYNFMSANPRNFSDELIMTLPRLTKWQKILHLPLQSGDDEILKRMNRNYTINQYLKILTKLKKNIYNLKISTDVIVGFPGETKKQFTKTYNLCKKIGFYKVYVSQYSQRSGTVAEKLLDSVNKIEKKRRWKKINDLINKS